MIAIALMLCPVSTAIAAKKKAPVSELVIDSATGKTIFALHPDQRRPPASLTKLMTLLLTFDALERGELKLNAQLKMTAEGERQAPSRLGLARGHSITVREALRSVAVISANDVTVALADRLGGSEKRFVGKMNRRAFEIGMTQTRFASATGLATGAGSSTARDIATLSRYIIKRYPSQYHLFATRAIIWKQQVRYNHNRLLGKIAGLDGLKTGFTVQAGYNLAASARRRGLRLIVVVMGANTAAARDLLVTNLLEAGFSVPPRGLPNRRL